MPTPDDFQLPVINPTPKPRKPGTFGPNNPPPGLGRRRGSVNKANRDLKNGLLTAAINLGRDGNGEGGLVGYCEFLGIYHPKAFSNLLGKLLPLNVTADVTTAPVAINIIGVPHDRYLSADDIAKSRGEPYQPPPEVTYQPLQLTAPIEEVAPQSSEEEVQLVNKLQSEVNELARRAGITLVQQ
jgi:hypothetical protein